MRKFGPILILFSATIALAADQSLDAQLQSVLQQAGFTGTIETQFATKLGRPINPQLAELGRQLFFDKSSGLHLDNMCGGCHSPSNGMGDSQTMAIGIQNNDIVGRGRQGPRNQRRTPSVVNTALYANLMWNGRFAAGNGNPFDPSGGFLFPRPDAATGPIGPAFSDPQINHLLIAQVHMPPTELTEVAGFTGWCTLMASINLDHSFCQFDDGKGGPLPQPNFYNDIGFNFNQPIRQLLLDTRFNNNPNVVAAFAQVFPQAAGGHITFVMFARAIAEFEFTLVFANAPIDQYARGDVNAMDTSEKRGALLFFGKAKCVTCHAVAGQSNEMFSDFQNRVAGVPQPAPKFGAGTGNTIFDGPGKNEDFGFAQLSGAPGDLYKFRTAPLRNLAVAPGLFHNGAYTKMEDAIQFHLNANVYGPQYDAKKAGLDEDLTYSLGPIAPVLAKLDPLLQNPPALSNDEFNDLVHFVKDGLLDPRATKTCGLIPSSVPSGLPLPKYLGCGNGTKN